LARANICQNQVIKRGLRREGAPMKSLRNGTT